MPEALMRRTPNKAKRKCLDFASRFDIFTGMSHNLLLNTGKTMSLAKKHTNEYLRFAVITILSLILAAALLGLDLSSSSLRIQDNTRVQKWQEDIDQLATELPEKHKDLFHSRPRADFESDISQLKGSLHTMTEQEVIFSLSKIVAAFGDAHTMLGYRPKVAFPLSLYWFQEGIFCINSLKEHREILDCRLLAIDGKPLEKVIDILTLAIAHENSSQLKKSIPNYLVYAEILYGAGIVSEQEKAVFTFENKHGQRFDVRLPSISMKSGFRPISSPRPNTPPPLYRKHQRAVYTFEYLPQEKMLYIAYNSCKIRKDKPFPVFVDEIFACADKNPVERFVIDIRNNGGGNSAVFAPMLRELKTRDALNRSERLFVIIGRRTFSSAVLNAIQLRNQTQAVFVGEPSGGRPNHFGEVRMFMLKHSRLPVTYSTKYFTISQEDTDAFYPDITVELSVQDFLSHRDPVVERIQEEI